MFSQLSRQRPVRRRADTRLPTSRNGHREAEAPDQIVARTARQRKGEQGRRVWWQILWLPVGDAHFLSVFDLLEHRVV
jgi:hypothetical protein